MSYEVLSDPVEAFDFITKHFRLLHTEDEKGIILKKDGVTIAAAMFVEYNGVNVFMHVAGTPGTRWLTRDFWFWCLHYPFAQLGCKRMTAWIESDNIQSVKFSEHSGWEREAVLKGAGSRGQDVFLYVLWKENCRHISQERLRRWEGR